MGHKTSMKIQFSVDHETLIFDKFSSGRNKRPKKTLDYKCFALEVSGPGYILKSALFRSLPSARPELHMCWLFIFLF